MNIPEVIDATDAQAANMINSVGLGISKRHDILSIIKKKSSKLSLDYKITIATCKQKLNYDIVMLPFPFWSLKKYCLMKTKFSCFILLSF